MKVIGTLLCTLICCNVAVAQQEGSEVDQKLIEAVQAAGGQAMPLAKNDARLQVAFHLADKEITDDVLTVVAGKTSVQSLNLRGTKITDAGLVHLAGMTGLQRLHLEKTAVTDAGLAHLAGLEALEYLNLYETSVTDAGLESLKSLKK